MKTFAVVYLASVKHGQHICEIHKAGCRDLSKKDNHQNVNAMSAQSVIEQELDDETREIGYTEKDYKEMPCSNVA